MIVALDYDRTYTIDPKAWDIVIATLRKTGHTVIVCTMRYDNEEGKAVIEDLRHKVSAIYFTGRKGKRDFLAKQGIRPHVWIDDMPEFILMDALA